MEKYEIDGIFTYDSPFNSPNLLWLTGFRTSDHILFLKNKGEEGVIGASFNQLDRVKNESFIKRVYDVTEYKVQLLKENRVVSDNEDAFIAPMLRDEFAGKTLGVPDEIPASILVILQKLGYDIKVVRDLLPDARATKSASEIKMIRKAGDATVGAIKEIIDLVKDTDIGPNKTLTHNGKPLTVGQIKIALEHFLVDRYAETSEDTILAVGKKAFDWHYLGNSGDKLKAEVPIILDVFPRLKIERYVADVT
ncbi:MAG: hypothetical protein ACFFE6_04240, partial [Candidatus Thorarchaeota archaeon]